MKEAAVSERTAVISVIRCTKKKNNEGILMKSQRENNPFKGNWPEVTFESPLKH